MKKVLSLLGVFLVISGIGYAMEDARLLRFPDVQGNLIAFVYAGDIWTVPATGGDARRLTSHEGLELFPKISPDGKWIAFSGEYGGNRQVYVIPVEGSTPRQLTFYNDVGIMPPRGGFDNIPLDWSPDSRRILVRMNRTPFGERMGKYFWVSTDDGMETPLQIPEAGFGTLSSDAKRIVYTPICREFRTWKRTKGGRAQDVWIYDLEKNQSQRITEFPGTDQHPFLYGEKIYFVSDRGLALNFWCYDLQSGTLRQVTDFQDYDVLWPSGDNGRLAFEKGGYIHLIDLDSEKTRKVTVNIHYDNPNRLPYFKDVSQYISRFGATISPEGKRVIFDARGDLFSVPADKKGVTVNVTRTQGVREMYPIWSPDGKWVAYISDASGDYELYLMDPLHKENPRQLTIDDQVWKYPPTWSPDSKKMLFYDIGRKLRLLDVASGKFTLIDTGFYDDLLDYDWSPDSRWVVYSKTGPCKVSGLWLYSLDQEEKFKVSGGEYNDYAAVFSQCGKYVFFISDRDFDMNFRTGFSSMEFDFIYNNTARVYALALNREAADLFKDENDLAPSAPPKEADSKDKKKEKDAAKVEPLKVDLEGISERVMVFPFSPGNYGGLADVGGKLLYLKGRAIRLYDFKTKKDEEVAQGIQAVALSGDNQKLLYRQGEKWGIMDVKPGQKPGKDMLDLSGLTMKIDPVKEWEQIFNDGWRIYRDWFYVQNMHGVDWPAVREKYARLLPYLSHRADLDYLFGEMVGELNAGHCYVNWGDFERPKRLEGGLLGAVLKTDEAAGRYRIARIFAGENWNERTRSPLTAQGIDVQEGDYIIKLNGYEVTTSENPYRFLENTAGKKIPITVNSRPTAQGARTYWIEPVSSELGLRYLDWVNSRRAMVDKLSKGRIAYIHVPDTAVSGNRELFKALYAYSSKEAFIIDERYNGGGWSPGKMIEKLSQRPVSFWHRRNLELRQEPAYALNGPMVMLINHYSSSGGDNFPFWFKKRNLGPLIGTRTWGGLIGYGWSPGLVDGPSFAVPMSGIVSTEGEFIVEGVGVYPDEGFEVYDRPEEVAEGRDPSIEVAVRYLLEQLKKNPPPKRPQTPDEPDRSQWFEKEIN